MDKRFFIVIYLCLYFFVSFGQGEIVDNPELFYKNEKSFAAMLNTTGIGGNFSYGKRINAYKKSMYQIDLVEIRHPKEVKISLVSPSFESSGSFVYGKLNKFFNFRFGTGLQKELYRKVDKGGVSIRRYMSAGLDLGIEKPVYYIVYEYLNTSYIRIERKFNTEPHASNLIERYASFFKGFDELRFIPGVFAKYAYMFEYSKDEKTLHAIEGGVIVDAFPRPIKLMAHNKNDYLFVSLYISYRFGKVIDARFKNKKNKIDRLINQ